MRLAEKAARRMREGGMQAFGFYLYIRMIDGSFLGKSKKLKHPINTGLELYDQALLLWKSWEFTAEVMYIAVGFTELIIKSEQLCLFDCSLPIHRPAERAGLNELINQRATTKDNLTVILDNINNKYGEFTIRSGLLTKTEDYAPDAIAFGK